MKSTKAFISCIIAICLVASLSISAAAATTRNIDKMTGYELTSSALTVKYNGSAVTFPDAQPFIDANNRTLIPVRFVAETMGATVSWDSAKSTAVITQNGITVNVPVGKDTITVTKNGTSTSVKMDTAAVIKSDRTYVPIRYVAESLGAWVGYANKYATVQIYKDVLTPEEITRLHGYYDMTFEEWYNSVNYKVSGDEDERCALSVPMTTYCVGAGGFENANEAKLRNPNGIYSLKDGSIPVAYSGELSGMTFKFGSQKDIEYSKLILAEATRGLERVINANGKVSATLRSDLSCIFWSRHSSEATTYVRGVLSITIPLNADIDYINQNYSFITNPIAGNSYNVDVQIYVDTYTKIVYYSNMAILK